MEKVQPQLDANVSKKNVLANKAHILRCTVLLLVAFLVSANSCDSMEIKPLAKLPTGSSSINEEIKPTQAPKPKTSVGHGRYDCWSLSFQQNEENVDEQWGRVTLEEKDDDITKYDFCEYYGPETGLEVRTINGDDVTVSSTDEQDLYIVNAPQGKEFEKAIEITGNLQEVTIPGVPQFGPDGRATADTQFKRTEFRLVLGTGIEVYKIIYTDGTTSTIEFSKSNGRDPFYDGTREELMNGTVNPNGSYTIIDKK